MHSVLSLSYSVITFFHLQVEVFSSYRIMYKKQPPSLNPESSRHMYANNMWCFSEQVLKSCTDY